jgi:hypothetical protein
MYQPRLINADRRTHGRTDRRTDRQTDGRTDEQTDGQTDRRANITKPVGPFQNYANASENAQRFEGWICFLLQME